MPKRKSTPVKNQNSSENWNSFSTVNDSFFQDEGTPAKAPRVQRVKTFTSNILRCTEAQEPYFVDRFLVGKSKNGVPESWKKCKVKFTEGVLMLNFDSEDYVIVQIDQTFFFLSELFSIKCLSFNFEINIETEDVHALIYLQLPLNKFTKKIGLVLKSLITKKFNVTSKVEYDDKKIKNSDNLDEFYNDINEYQKNHDYSYLNNDINVQHSSLLPQLRPYQVKAVKWMIEKEKHVDQTSNETLHPLYEEIILDSGQIIYFNIYTGYIDIDKPVVPPRTSGGILADEMGLGKTVEVLACILNNPRPDFDENFSDTTELCDALTVVPDTAINLDKKCEVKSEMDAEENMLNTSNSLDESKTKDKTLNDSQSEENLENSTDPTDISQTEIKDETIPQVEMQSKYIKPKAAKKKAEKAKGNPKLDRVDKPKKPKSAAKIAAQLWYENKLAEMKIKEKPKRRNEELEVKCVCGDLSESGVIHCKYCNKMQHPQCLGYNGAPKDFICPQCWLNKPLIKSKATLIVSPISICRQWSQEIQSHIRKGGLRVLIYKGIHKAGAMYPTDLADYDLIITTYNVLQSELKFSQEEEFKKSFRYAKRYNNPSTPLLNINFWRLCLDEAQMVDCPSSQVSCMAHQLNAVHRWAVTGTPIQKNISDLYGLVEYLKLFPYNDLYTWKNLLFYPYLHGDKEPLLNFLSTVLWRSAKSDVLTQIDIPPQSFVEHWFEFSAVEKYFYKKEHFCAANDFLDKLKGFESLDVRLKSLDKHVLSKILAPLLALRQTCVHPHSVRGRYLAKSKVNSMEDLLEALIKKNVKECKETLRAKLASLNGMAGIMLLKDNILEAVETYREALQVMSKYHQYQFIKIDKLQKVHTLYNLCDILTDKRPGYPTPPPTLRDDKLAEECEQVQRQYMEKFISETRAAFEDAQVATKTVTKLKKKFILQEGEWLCELNDWFIMKSYDDEFMRRVNNSLDANCKIKYEDIASTRSIMYLLTTWQDKRNIKSQKLEKLFTQFQNEFCTVENDYQMDEKIVMEAMECHLRPSKNKKNAKKKLCMICLLDKSLKQYECDIFLMKSHGTIDSEEDKYIGSWRPSFEEGLVKCKGPFIYSSIKSKSTSLINT